MIKKIGLNLLIITIAIGAGLSLSLKPWRVYEEQRRQTIAQIAATREAEQREIADMQLEAHIGSSIGREELARKQGYRKPNEVPMTTNP
jgi:cell division protein FtsB